MLPMIKKTKTKAVKVAKEQVGEMFKVGDGYSYHLWVDDMNAWYETTPREKSAAMANRSQHLIDVARNYLRLENKEYKGGIWTKYLG